jgi:hypothetical protein
MGMGFLMMVKELPIISEFKWKPIIVILIALGQHAIPLLN